MSKRRLGAAFLGFALSLSGQTLKKLATIELPGPKGPRFDYLTMDEEDRYLLSAHLGPGILYVIEVRTNTLVKAIPGVPGITGLEYVPGLRKVYTSDWGEEKIGVVDLHTMSVIKRLPTAAKPNGSTYATPFRKVYVSDTLGKAVAVVDVDKDQIVKTLQFDSETGMPQYDSVARRVYVNLRSTNRVAEIDPSTDTIMGQYPVDGCVFNHGMAPTGLLLTCRFLQVPMSSSSIQVCVVFMPPAPVEKSRCTRKKAPTIFESLRIFPYRS